MGALKFYTLGNINYRIDRRGKLYIDNGKVRRSKDNFYYEVAVSVNGRHWQHDSNQYGTRKEAMAVVKNLVS